VVNGDILNDEVACVKWNDGEGDHWLIQDSTLGGHIPSLPSPLPSYPFPPSLRSRTSLDCS